ncbi:MAG TPA: ribbon-helix-helix domain-containing protein [Candidatus Obscuribacterales bacterium]
MNPIPHRTSTTDMEVTSIRLERDLKERLKQLADKQGYQALIRDILWDYVQQRADRPPKPRSLGEIRFTVAAIARRPEICWLTGADIAPHEPMLLGLTLTDEMVPLSAESIDP